MADKIYLHFSEGIAAESVYYTAKNGVSWAQLTTFDPTAQNGNSWHELEARASGNPRKQESIQVALVHSKSMPTQGIIKFYASRGQFAPIYTAPGKSPGTKANCQRLIARIAVSNGRIDFSKSRFREIVPPRRKHAGQNDHRPDRNNKDHSRHFKVLRTPRSADRLPPTTGPLLGNTATMRPFAGLLLTHGGLRIAFSPQGRV